MFENSGCALPEGALHSESATVCTQSELAVRSIRSTKPRRKIILGRHQATRRVTDELGTTPLTTNFSGIPLSTFTQQDTTRDKRSRS